MKHDKGFYEYVFSDLLEGVEGIISKSMFGGHALYKDGVIFGMIINGKLFFKADELNKKDFEHLGSKQFTYTHKNGKSIAMSYYEVPQEIMENRHNLRNWLQKSLFASMREKRKGTKGTEV